MGKLISLTEYVEKTSSWQPPTVVDAVPRNFREATDDAQTLIGMAKAYDIAIDGLDDEQIRRAICAAMK